MGRRVRMVDIGSYSIIFRAGVRDIRHARPDADVLQSSQIKGEILMSKRKKITITVIIGLALALLIVPYLYNHFVHAPNHPAPGGTPVAVE